MLFTLVKTKRRKQKSCFCDKPPKKRSFIIFYTLFGIYTNLGNFIETFIKYSVKKQK